MKKLRLGLKLWSTNIDQLFYAKELYAQGIFQYLELTAIPRSFSSTAEAWSKFGGPIIIHAPQIDFGFNLADQALRVSNRLLLAETVKFADYLQADTIILHPGENGSLEEIVTQIKDMRGNRFLLENLPYQELINKYIGRGSLPEEMGFLLNKLPECGFCLDFTHAFCSAVSYKIDPYSLINDFIKLNPFMYHLADTHIESSTDKHLSIGSGNVDFQRILSLIPEDSLITIESGKDLKKNLEDFLQDVKTLKQAIIDYN